MEYLDLHLAAGFGFDQFGPLVRALGVGMAGIGDVAQFENHGRKFRRAAALSRGLA